MVNTIQALVATLIAVVPGAAYVAAYDGQLGQGRSALRDRLTRYLLVSVSFHAILAPWTYTIWHAWVRSDRLEAGSLPPLLLYVPALLYLVAPAVVGLISGRAARRTDRGFLFHLAARLPTERLRARVTDFAMPVTAPTAWDHIFTRDVPGWVRIKLRSGTWIGGPWMRHESRPVDAHAVAFPEGPELFLPMTVGMDDEGRFHTAPGGSPELRDEGVLVSRDDIEVLYFEYADIETGGT